MLEFLQRFHRQRDDGLMVAVELSLSPHLRLVSVPRRRQSQSPSISAYRMTNHNVQVLQRAAPPTFHSFHPLPPTSHRLCAYATDVAYLLVVSASAAAFGTNFFL